MYLTALFAFCDIFVFHQNIVFREPFFTQERNLQKGGQLLRKLISKRGTWAKRKCETSLLPNVILFSLFPSLFIYGCVQT